MRVTRKLSPTDRGALKLAEAWGDNLVCVRHRCDAKGEYRYTTVELLVDKAKVHARPGTPVVDVRIEPGERDLQAAVRAAGAKWDATARVWNMPRRIAGILRLTSRIIQKK